MNSIRGWAFVALLPLVSVQACAPSQEGEEPEGQAEARLPIIDVHLHALGANAFGPPPVPACAAELWFTPPDPGALPPPDRGPGERYDLELVSECDPEFVI